MIRSLILSLVVLLAVLSGTAFAETCSTCDECTEDLDGKYAYVELTTNINDYGFGDCIEISGSNVEFDCKGYLMDGDDEDNSHGIIINGSDAALSNVKVRNCNVSDFETGIYAFFAPQLQILNSSIYSNHDGIKAISITSGATIEGNVIRDNTNRGIYANLVMYTRIASNHIFQNKYGIYAAPLTRSNVTQNNVSSNELDGIKLTSRSEYINLSQNDMMFNGENGIGFYDNSSFNLMSDTRILYNSHNGAFINDSHEVLVANCNVSKNNWTGVVVSGSFNTTLTNNRVCNNNNTDIASIDSEGDSGSSNACDAVDNWEDADGNSCAFSCREHSVNCSSCVDCTEKLDGTYEMVHLNQSISASGTCINVSADDVIFDCRGYNITGAGWWTLDMGVNITSREHVTVYNCTINNFRHGVYSTESNHSELVHNTISWNGFGFSILKTHNLSVTFNNASNNVWYGFVLTSANKTNLDDNFAINSSTGFSLMNSNYTSIARNTVEENKWAVSVHQIYNASIIENNICSNEDYDINVSSSSNMWGDENTCDNAYNWSDDGAIGCTNDCSGIECNSCENCTKMLNGSYGKVDLVNNISINGSSCINITGSNVTFDCKSFKIEGNNTSGSMGINASGVSNLTIDHCEVEGFYHGIYFYNVNNSRITENEAVDNNYTGIYLHHSTNNTLQKNILSANRIGLRLNHSHDNTIFNINASDNSLWGIILINSSENDLINSVAHSNQGSWNSIGIGLFQGSTHNRVMNNTAFNNTIDGIELWEWSSNNTIADNTCFGNEIGILLLNNSDQNNITNNELKNNKIGLSIGNGSWGDSDHNIVHMNEIHNNTDKGIYLHGDSTGNTLFYNIVCINGIDIHDDDSNSGHNNTCNSTQNWNDDGTSDCTYSCNVTFTINLSQGWNLFSIPVTYPDMSISNVFGQIEDNYTFIATTNESGHLVFYANGTGFNEIDPIRGYLIHMTENDTIEIMGAELPMYNIRVRSGLNILGYPRLESRAVSAVLDGISYSSIWTTTPSSWIMGAGRFGFTNMSAGNGYMLYATSEGEFTV